MLILEDDPEQMFGASWYRSTRSQSKQRRDLINKEINNLRELLPFPLATRHRLSQLQLMACICVYLRKHNFLSQVLSRQALHASRQLTVSPSVDFGKALGCSMLMCTVDGKLLYIGENTAEIMGQSLEDLLSHGDSLYDLVDKKDHAHVQFNLEADSPTDPVHFNFVHDAFAGLNAQTSQNERRFLCRINSPRNLRRQGRFAEQKAFSSLSKVVAICGYFLPPHAIPQPFPVLSSSSLTTEKVFLARCSALLTPDNRDSFVSGIGCGTTFSTLHQLDMRVIGANKQTKAHLGRTYRDLLGRSWYGLIHWDDIQLARETHATVATDEHSLASMVMVRVSHRSGKWIWCHVVLQVVNSKEPEPAEADQEAPRSGEAVPPKESHKSSRGSEAQTESSCPQRPKSSEFTSDDPGEPDDEDVLSSSSLILCTYQILGDDEKDVLQQSPWFYDSSEYAYSSSDALRDADDISSARDSCSPLPVLRAYSSSESSTANHQNNQKKKRNPDQAGAKGSNAKRKGKPSASTKKPKKSSPLMVAGQDLEAESDYFTNSEGNDPSLAGDSGIKWETESVIHSPLPGLRYLDRLLRSSVGPATTLKNTADAPQWNACESVVCSAESELQEPQWASFLSTYTARIPDNMDSRMTSAFTSSAEYTSTSGTALPAVERVWPAANQNPIGSTTPITELTAQHEFLHEADGAHSLSWEDEPNMPSDGNWGWPPGTVCRATTEEDFDSSLRTGVESQNAWSSFKTEVFTDLFGESAFRPLFA